ncbi:MAG: hypothetical protein M3417_09075, partial [Actinomycetota bacterium]|nr:hypothetical protein [Actinomycetota bacterium]
MGVRGEGQRRRRPIRALTALGLGLDAVVVGVDLLTPDFDVPVAPLLVAPLLPAVAGLLEATASLAGLSLALAVALLAAHGTLGDAQELVRLATVAIVCCLAIVGSRLRRKADELAQALDTLPDAVTIQAAGGTVLYANRAAARL